MANQEQLDILAQGVEAWNQWKTDTQEVHPQLKWELCYDADLSGADLHGHDLSGVNFGLVDLSESNLANAYLVGAYLPRVELIESNLAGAHLSGANLNQANLGGANFNNANLSGADLSGTDLSDANLQGANLSHANLSRADLSGVDLQGVDLSGANLSGAYYGTVFNRAKIRQVRDAGALVEWANVDQRRAEQRRVYKRTWFWLKKKTNDQDIIFYPRVVPRSLLVIGASLLFVLVGVWMLMSSPDNLIQMVVAGIGILFFGLGGVAFLFQLLRQLVYPIPLLVLNEEGIHYFSSYVLGQMDKKGMTSLKWKEIGAFGLITSSPTNIFAFYTSTTHWRSGWFPRMRVEQRFLPISIKRLLALLQEHYQAQMAAYHIETVELVDADSFSAQKKKNPILRILHVG